MLPGGLYAYRTPVRKATGETLFSMAYGIEAVILVQVTTMSNLYTKERTELKNVGIL